ncbi:MAG: ATP-binding cassette domain-containing protein [Actinophytocola sp.]|uniref:ABC transporter ATP-binding protein n=1 Tax=Actinophytocola sp. TaxID=1872138 RepID=UPI00132BE613|nr:ABC transporter ATP-binding protein [Actinophytocola sp.]MPZ83542.1 ATP-binding cassette domain-containing protein [Actinophytocola sp.]
MFGETGEPAEDKPATATEPIRAEDIHISYGGVTAAEGVDLHVEPGEFVSLLGPSGSGKTSMLRAIAGFVKPDRGRVLIGGRDITRLAPRFRNFGMVFQRYALFPNMTVRDNVAFGLRARSVGHNEIRAHVDAALDVVGLEDLGRRYPAQLSGGQQQRVALARAIVIRPTLLLMDEPLGALDLRLRQQLQVEIRRLQRELAISTIYVTHDQEEAFSMSDRVVVMSRARVSAAGSPDDLIYRPSSRFAATFVGNNTLLDVRQTTGNGVVQMDRLPGQSRPFRLSGPPHESTRTLLVVLRPDQIHCDRRSRPGAVAGHVVERRFTGLEHLVTIRTADRVMSTLDRGLGLRVGDEVFLTWDPAGVHVIEEDADGNVVGAPGGQRAQSVDQEPTGSTVPGLPGERR